MPISIPGSVSLIPPTQQSGGSVKNAAIALTRNSQGSKDAALFSSAGDGLANVQSQVDFVMNVLRKPLPQPQIIQITNPSGALVAEIGNLTGSDNKAYFGIWANNLYIGGMGPDTAKIVALSDGSITIDGATIILDANGVTTEISNALNPWSGNGSSIVSVDNATGNYSFIDPFNFAILTATNVPVVYIESIPSGSNAIGKLFVTETVGGASVSIRGDTGIDVSTGVINQDVVITGTQVQVGTGAIKVTILNTNVDSPGYSVSGAAGIDAVFGGHTFSKGILVA